MVDIVDTATRSRMMSNIKSKNTRPEVALRKRLHSLGFRYSLHHASLPGQPDLALPKWNTAIFVHGCFWHWHGCSLSKMPQSRREFWEAKLKTNQERDNKNLAALLKSGWRCIVVWECSIKGRAGRENLSKIADQIARWITQESETLLIIEGLGDGKQLS